jgi:tetratricopeptide (TPR) repeat protein
MADLPFLVAHGTVVWQALVAASLVLGGLSASFLVHRAMRARAARVREALGKPSHEARVQDAGTCVTLEGTLELLPDEIAGTPAVVGDAVVTVVPQGLEQSDEPNPKARSASARGAKMALDVAGTRVLLDGAVQVLAGSRETERCVGKAQALALLWDFAGPLGTLPPRAFAIRALATGDRVRARGVLRHEPVAEAGSDYRTGRAAFSLEEDRQDPDLPLIALAAASRPRPLVRSPARTLLRALPIPLAVIAGLAAAGEIGVRLGTGAGWTVAAATPFRRADALTLLRGDIDLRFGTDAAKLSHAVAYDQIRGRCDDAADDTFAHNDLAASARIAEACGDPLRQARALFAQADFDKAAAAFSTARRRDPRVPATLSEATAYIATGRHEGAAIVLRALAKTWEDSPRARERLECAAMAMDVRGEHPEVAVNIEERARMGSDVPGCAALAADVLEGDKRATLVRRVSFWGPTPLTDWRRIMDVIALEQAEPGWRGAPSIEQGRADDIVFDPRRGLYTVPPGLAEVVAASLATRADAPGQELRATLLLNLARLDAYLGEPAAARARVAQAREALQAAKDVATRELAELEKARRGTAHDGDYDDYGYSGDWQLRQTRSRVEMRLSDLDAYDVAIDAREGKRSPSDAGRFELRMAVAATAAHDESALTWLSQRDTRDINQRLWTLALGDDYAGLTRKLEERGLDGRGVVDYVGGRPALSAELSRWIRHGYPAACTSCGLYPLANVIASRRDAAASAGATDVVAETTAATKRIRELLLRRDVAIPLAVISELSPP